MSADAPAPAPETGQKRPRDADLTRIAELVMILSGLGEMRAGRSPSAAEREMAAEAKQLLVGVCEGMQPKDLFSRDAVRSVVEDLGLNRPMDPHRPKKLSIKEKLEVTKKRMEEKKELAKLHPPQPHGSMFPGAPRFLPDRPTQMASSARGEHAPGRIAPILLQSTSTATVGLGQENKLLDHSLGKSEGVHEGNASESSQLIRSQGTQASVTQNTPGNQLSAHQPSQSTAHTNATSSLSNHSNIAKSVMRVLQQNISSHPNWTLPLIDYMNKPLDCQICKILINDTESLVVCDFCEMGTHLKCLQTYGSKGIPKADWFCPKCVLASNGKAYPPKYGRVTRSNTPMAKAPSNPVGTQAPREKRAETTNSTVNVKSETKGNLDLPPRVNGSNVASSHAESVSDSKAISTREMKAAEMPSVVTKKEDVTSHERGLTVCSTSGTQNESSCEQTGSGGISSSDMQRAKHELESENTSDQACSRYQNGTPDSDRALEVQAQIDTQVCNGNKVLASVEFPPDKLHEVSETNGDGLKLPKIGGLPKSEGHRDSERHEQANSNL